MKKVLLSITTLFGGGAERVVSVWANQLSHHGYDVSILLYGRSEGEYPVDNSVKIHTVADTYEDYQKLSYFERLKKMRKIVKKIKPDIMINFLPRMQIWMMLATLGMKLNRVETVRVSPWEICKNNKYERFLWKKCFSIANKVIVQTAEQAEYFSKKIQKKCFVIPNPIAEQYRDNEKITYSTKNKEFIAVGRIMLQKNFDMLIRAFSKAVQTYPDIKLSIFGVGDIEDKLKELITQLNMQENIKLMGRSNKVLEELLCRDVFLMSSDFEGMPNALAEAMATGLVCVSTDCRTGPKDLIDNGVNGFLVPTGDEAKMLEAIIKLAQMPKEESEKVGKAARNKILSFCSEENSFNRLVDLIEN